MSTAFEPACPRCGAPYAGGASFCEGCGADLPVAAGSPLPPDRAALTPGTAPASPGSPGSSAPGDPVSTGGPGAPAGGPVGPAGGAGRPARVGADPVTAAAGEESPLDVGWTGPVARETGSLTAPVSPGPGSTPCASCGVGHDVDGYCDVCGTKTRDPRDHFEEEPAPWVAGVCDIGRRHHRNEDALALAADPDPLSFAVVVVCDGVSNSVDSHVASLAASRAARDVLAAPLPRGMGTRTALVASATTRLDEAVAAARRAVVDTTTALATGVDSPPSCTLVAAVVCDGVAVVGNVGDSRAYWLPDDPATPARQLGRDDSFAQEQMEAGVPRRQAETGPGAHAITRWLGADSPDDLTPHPGDVDLDHDGWLLLCSDGLWNYCSEAADLQMLVHARVAGLGAAGHHPASLARTLTGWANEQGGTDNISVALVRVGDVGPAPASRAAPTGWSPGLASEPPTLPPTEPPTEPSPPEGSPETKDIP